MSSRRLMLLAAPLLLASGCAELNLGTPTTAPATPATAFATHLEQADQSVEAAVSRMDGYERNLMAQEQAILYAIGQGAAARQRPGAGAVEAAGAVLAPAFTAMGDYAHILNQASTGAPVRAKPSPTGAEMAAHAEQGLNAVAAAVGRPITPAVRAAGLAGIVALADLPEALTKRPGEETLTVVLTEAQPHVVAIVAMLREVVGAEQGVGTRGAIRARRLRVDAAENRFLAAVRSDRSAGTFDRYNMYRTIAESRANDPELGTFGSIAGLLNTLEAAQTALTANPSSPDAAAKVAAFEASAHALTAAAESIRRN